MEARSPMKLRQLLKIGSVAIMITDDESYIQFISGLAICNDGSGPAHGDPHYKPMTAYYNGGRYLSADRDKYIVIPPQVRKLIKPKVMGCQSRLTNLKTESSREAVCGEIGPANKTGEAAFCLASLVNPSVTHNSGDKNRDYLY